MSSMSYNASGVLYDSDSEAVDYNGLSYDDLLNSNFNDPTFVESYLCRYIGKGPGMERVLLIIPSVSPRVISNHDDALRLMVKVLDEHLDRKYSLVICQTCVSWTDSNSYYFVNQCSLRCQVQRHQTLFSPEGTTTYPLITHPH
eukprot:XP_763114.1 hypothetical protein [Theileria parva strain Muguga]